MSIQVRVPDLGDGIESGDVLEILVREGDQIKKDQGIVELETEMRRAAEQLDFERAIALRERVRQLQKRADSDPEPTEERPKSRHSRSRRS